MGVVLPVCIALPRSHRGLGAASNVAGCTASLKPSGSWIRWAREHSVKCWQDCGSQQVFNNSLLFILKSNCDKTMSTPVGDYC